MSTTETIPPERDENVSHATLVEALYAFADFLTANPDAPVSSSEIHVGVHITERGDYDAAVRTYDLEPDEERVGPYDTAARWFGPIRYGVQTHSSMVERLRERIAALEAELGLTASEATS